MDFEVQNSCEVLTFLLTHTELRTPTLTVPGATIPSQYDPPLTVLVFAGKFDGRGDIIYDVYFRSTSRQLLNYARPLGKVSRLPPFNFPTVVCMSISSRPSSLPSPHLEGMKLPQKMIGTDRCVMSCGNVGRYLPVFNLFSSGLICSKREEINNVVRVQ